MPVDFDVRAVAGDWHHFNGCAQRRVVLSVDGSQKAVQRVTLDSDLAVRRTAKAWASDHGIDEQVALQKLRDMGLSVVAEAAEQANKQAAPGLRSRRRVSHIAESLIQDLKPLWHRKQRTIFLDVLKLEKSISTLWTLATDAHVDEVLTTVEGQGSNTGEPPNYRQRLSLLKDAIAMAASRAVRSLPEVTVVDQDATVDHDQLLDKLVVWMLRARSFRLDCGTPISTTYLQWARGVEVGAGWRMCFSAPVFARIGDQAAQPEVAVQGRVLAPELRYESSRKLAADLRATGLADPNHTLKVTAVTAVTWRAWLLSPSIITSVLTADPIGNVTDPDGEPKMDASNTR